MASKWIGLTLPTTLPELYDTHLRLLDHSSLAGPVDSARHFLPLGAFPSGRVTPIFNPVHGQARSGPVIAHLKKCAEQPDSGADAGAAMAGINTVPKLGEGDSSNKASQACLDFFALQTIARGCPA